MTIGRAQRRAERLTVVRGYMGEELADVALDLLEVVEFGWHDCYQEVTPPPDVVDDILVCSEGTLDKMIRAARLALTDWRDLRLWADARRARGE